MEKETTKTIDEVITKAGGEAIPELTEEDLFDEEELTDEQKDYTAESYLGFGFYTNDIDPDRLSDFLKTYLYSDEDKKEAFPSEVEYRKFMTQIILKSCRNLLMPNLKGEKIPVPVLIKQALKSSFGVKVFTTSENIWTAPRRDAIFIMPMSKDNDILPEYHEYVYYKNVLKLVAEELGVKEKYIKVLDNEEKFFDYSKGFYRIYD